MKKRYHINILASSQERRSAIKRMCLALHAQYMGTLEKRAEMRTILSVLHVSLMSIATGAVFLQMSASTHLECYSGASRCVLIGGTANSKKRNVLDEGNGVFLVQRTEHLVRTLLERERTAKEQKRTAKF